MVLILLLHCDARFKLVLCIINISLLLYSKITIVTLRYFTKNLLTVSIKGNNYLQDNNSWMT